MKTPSFSKIIGWLLFSIGLLIIFYGLYSSFNIFTGRSSPPRIFVFVQEETSSLEKEPLTGKIDEKEIITEMISEQIKSIVPLNFSEKLLNLISWSIFAGILFFGGGKIAGLGIKLIKEK